MQFREVSLATGLLFIVAGAASSAEIEVMTQNQYVGTDLIGLVASPDFNAAVVAALETRAASLPGERAKALAALIGKRDPALVGLQEAYRFTCFDGSPGDALGCEHPSFAGAFTDQLQDTLAALGGRYVAAATVVNLDLPASLPPPLNQLPGIPITAGGTVIFVGVVDRDVILARDDVDYSVIDFTLLQGFGLCARPSSADGCNYLAAASATLQVPSPVPGQPPVAVPVRFERGFVGVDAVVDGVPYRFVNTHLETRLETFGPVPPFGRVFQHAQALELTATLQALQAVAPVANTLLAGDINSDPRDEVLPVPDFLQGILGTTEIVPPYKQFADAGFTDVWTLRPGANEGRGAPLVGYSCCQAEDLSNHRSAHYERIDVIFSLAAPQKVLDARLLGESVADKTGPPGLGLWPSDHASVAARLKY